MDYKEVFKEKYKIEISNINNRIKTVLVLDSLNSKCHKYNWVFLHPNTQVIMIQHFEKRFDSDNIKYQLFEFVAKQFLNLMNTVHMIHGVFVHRPYLKDYIQSIEESVVLTLQKDFRGSILTLLPVIEGVLRKLLIAHKGIVKEKEIRMSELLKVFNNLSKTYVENQLKYLQEDKENAYLREKGYFFDGNQIKQLKKQHKKYFDLWAKQIIDYLENNLYLKTNQNNNVTDTFNRHIIFHALEDKVEFSFSNYLRLYNCIIFLSLLIGKTHHCYSVSDLDEKVALDKFLDYSHILAVSESMTETKEKIFRRKIISFKPFLDKPYFELIERPPSRLNFSLTSIMLSKFIHKSLKKLNIKL